MNKVILPFSSSGGGGGGGDFTAVKKLEAPESYAGNVGTTRETTCKVALEANKKYNIYVVADGGVTRVGSANVQAPIFLSYSGTSTTTVQSRDYAIGNITYGNTSSNQYGIGDGSSGVNVTVIGAVTSVGTDRKVAQIVAGIHTDTAGDLALRIYAQGVGNDASDEIFINGATMYVQEV